MKLLFLYISLLLISMKAANSFYDLSFQSLDGNLIKTSSYEGKKVVIAVVSTNAAGIRLVKYLDSVQKANDSIRAIAIPTGDFKGDVNIQTLRDLKKNVRIVITKPVKVKKDNAAQQHALFSWLTKSAENNHFNMDVSGEGQLFFINAKGTLYSVLPNQTPLRIVTKIIHQPFAESL